jgi:capsular exopolysaccharide synthesis family protein
VGLYVAEHPRAPISEAFRSLRTNIQFASVDHPVRILVVSSAGPEEGKSTVAANLAVVMAQGDKRVILVDADLRRPSLHELLGLPNRLGLSDLFLRVDVTLERALQSGGTPNLRVLTSGKLPPNPAELMGSERMAKLLSEMRAEADLVIMDAPPALVVTDAALLGARSDGLLLVVQPGKTRQDAATSAVESLKRTGTKVIGVVFNNVPIKHNRYYTDYRYASYYQSKKEEGPEERNVSAGVPSPTVSDPPTAPH